MKNSGLTSSAGAKPFEAPIDIDTRAQGDRGDDSGLSGSPIAANGTRPLVVADEFASSILPDPQRADGGAEGLSQEPTTSSERPNESGRDDRSDLDGHVAGGRDDKSSEVAEGDPPDAMETPEEGERCADADADPPAGSTSERADGEGAVVPEARAVSEPMARSTVNQNGDGENDDLHGRGRPSSPAIATPQKEVAQHAEHDLAAKAAGDDPTQSASPERGGQAAEQRPDIRWTGGPLSEPIIDQEFSTLTPPSSADADAQLERNIKRGGCRDSIVVWNDGARRIVLDGHKRLEICRRHDLSYNVEEINPRDREGARQWIIENQLGRRNLTRDAQAYLLGKLYSSYKCQGARTDQMAGQSDQKLTAAERLASEYHLGEKTIRRFAEFAEQLDNVAKRTYPAIKDSMLAGELKMSHADVARLDKLDTATCKPIAAQIIQGKAAAPLINEALEVASANDGHSSMEPDAAPKDDADSSATPPAAQVGAVVKRADTRGPPPAAAPRSLDPASSPVEEVVDASPVATAIWALETAERALYKVPKGEIPADILAVLRDRLRDVDEILLDHLDAADE